MTSLRRLSEDLKPLVDALLPDELVRQERANRVVVNDDNTVNPDAILPGLPWSRIDWDFPGAVTTGSSVGRRRQPQGGRLEMLTIDARIAPSTGACTYRVTVGGQSELVSLPKGAASGTSTSVNIPIPAGDTLVLDCLSDGGAEGVTISAFISQGGA